MAEHRARARELAAALYDDPDDWLAKPNWLVPFAGLAPEVLLARGGEDAERVLGFLSAIAIGGHHQVVFADNAPEELRKIARERDAEIVFTDEAVRPGCEQEHGRMSKQAALDAIARGDATPSEASAVLAPILEHGDAELLADVYVALRAWAWKALDGRWRDEDLRGWHAVISTSATVMGHRGQPGLSERLRALAELLQESIAVAEGLEGVDLLRHAHVAALLGALRRLGGEARRADIAAEAAIGATALSRTLNLVVAAGVVELVPGETAVFRLSRSGMEVVSRQLDVLVDRPDPKIDRYYAALGRQMAEFEARYEDFTRSLELLRSAIAGMSPAEVEDAIVALLRPLGRSETALRAWFKEAVLPGVGQTPEALVRASRGGMLLDHIQRLGTGGYA